MDFGDMIMDQVLGAFMFAINLIIAVFKALFEAKDNVPPEPPAEKRPRSKVH